MDTRWLFQLSRDVSQDINWLGRLLDVLATDVSDDFLFIFLLFTHTHTCRSQPFDAKDPSRRGCLVFDLVHPSPELLVSL